MTTKHTHGPNFGRHVDGCPRCGELAAGAPPVQWNRTRQQQSETRRAAEIRDHDCTRSRCVVCTFGDW
ncbi:hypothetical protein [Streptomyces sp. NRRL F-5065]|uniref:hypothetical protein n=1 Tax=Streptomyces sp. NRRL F-5065 TaxID=1463855 RepID=UPI0004BF47EB|nr:hypothetical protein [Streptomyces sp. NRRL F-5065]